MFWLAWTLIAFAGGVTQTLTGFGAALVMMLVLPYFRTVVQSAAAASATAAVLSVFLIWQYKQYLKPRRVLPSLVLYLAASLTLLQFVQKIETRVLAIIFGAFLTVLSLYYLVWSDRAHMRINGVTMVACPVVSGISSAMFGIGGPLMSLMFLEKYETREEYNTNLQLLFFIAAVINNVIRASKGIITLPLLPSIAAAVAAILAGERVGLILAGKMKPDLLRKMVYLMVLVSGVITILNNI